MKKAIVFLVAFIVLTAFIINTQSPIQQKPMDLGQTESSAPSPLYIVKTYGDIIGVFPYNQSVPVKLVNLYVATLPKEDQSLLNKGISIYSKDELNRLMEDYEVE